MTFPSDRQPSELLSSHTTNSIDVGYKEISKLIMAVIIELGPLYLSFSWILTWKECLYRCYNEDIIVMPSLSSQTTSLTNLHLKHT